MLSSPRLHPRDVPPGNYNRVLGVIEMGGLSSLLTPTLQSPWLPFEASSHGNCSVLGEETGPAGAGGNGEARGLH